MPVEIMNVTLTVNTKAVQEAIAAQRQMLRDPVFRMFYAALAFEQAYRAMQATINQDVSAILDAARGTKAEGDDTR